MPCPIKKPFNSSIILIAIIVVRVCSSNNAPNPMPDFEPAKAPITASIDENPMVGNQTGYAFGRCQ